MASWRDGNVLEANLGMGVPMEKHNRSFAKEMLELMPLKSREVALTDLRQIYQLFLFLFFLLIALFLQSHPCSNQATKMRGELLFIQKAEISNQIINV